MNKSVSFSKHLEQPRFRSKNDIFSNLNRLLQFQRAHTEGATGWHPEKKPALGSLTSTFFLQNLFSISSMAPSRMLSEGLFIERQEATVHLTAQHFHGDVYSLLFFSSEDVNNPQPLPVEALSVP